MKVVYSLRSKNEQGEKFTFGKAYQVSADYRNRVSGQKVRDNGFVVVDNNGEIGMLFADEVVIVEDDVPYYEFSYSSQKEARHESSV